MTTSLLEERRDEHPTRTTTTIVGSRSNGHRRISWAAIFGGVLLVVAVQLLFSLLGAGIGLGTVNVTAGDTPSANSFGIGASLWWVISSCLALGFGSFVAAWLAGLNHRFDGVLHGLVTWGAATLLTMWLLTSAIGGVLGGSFSALGSVVSAAGSGISAAAAPIAQAAGVSPDMLSQQASAYLQPANPDPAAMSPQEAQKAIATNLATYADGGSDAAPARQRVVDIMAAQMHISRDEAASRFDTAQAKFKQAREQAVKTARQAADATAAAASKTAFSAFGVLLLGAIAAAIGGAIPVSQRYSVSGRLPE